MTEPIDPSELPDSVYALVEYQPVEDMLLASYGRSGEGWFNNTGLMYGFKNKARSLGVSVKMVLTRGADG